MSELSNKLEELLYWDVKELSHLVKYCASSDNLKLVKFYAWFHTQFRSKLSLKGETEKVS